MQNYCDESGRPGTVPGVGESFGAEGLRVGRVVAAYILGVHTERLLLRVRNSSNPW
jgi:hypothetical protein